MFSRLPIRRTIAATIALFLLAVGLETAQAQRGRARRGDDSGRMVLVEAFVSQGCNLCPEAEQLLRKLREEFGPERIAVVSFHVDYFNEPWKDPFSDPDFSRREYQYSTINDREHKRDNPNYLYLTPLVIIDGRTPMVGSNQEALAVATRAIKAGLAERPAASLQLKLAPESAGGPRLLTVEVAASGPGSDLAGQEVLVEVVMVEDGLSTAVKSGELAGQTYKADNVARSFAAKPVQLGRDGKPETLQFPITLPKGVDPARSRLVALVQDETNGRVYQAATIPWRTANPDGAADATATAPGR